MDLFTIMPGAATAINAGESGSVFTNRGTGVVTYSDSDPRSDPTGTIGPGVSTTLFGTQYLTTTARAEMAVVPILDDFAALVLRTTALESTRALKANLSINVRDAAYDAPNDGVADATVEIQAAITDAAAAVADLGGLGIADVILPYGDYAASGLSNPGNVRLVSNGARLFANDSGPILTMTGSRAAVQGLGFYGGGADMDANAVVWDADTYWGHMEMCYFDGFAGRALLLRGIAHDVRSCVAGNCLLDAPGAKTGVVELAADSSDCYIEKFEATASVSSLLAGAYRCAFKVNGGSHFLSKLVGEISDIGIYVDVGASIQASLCRADLNYGHGWEIVSGAGQFVGCKALRNGRETTNTYDGFNVTAGNFLLSACISESLAADGWKHRYGFNDAQGSDTIKNRYSHSVSYGHATRGFNTNNANGAAVTFDEHPAVTLAAGATPSVDQVRQANLNNGSATTVTALLDGVSGQRVTLWGDGNSTLQHNGAANGFFMQGVADLLLGTHAPRDFVNRGGVWYEVG